MFFRHIDAELADMYTALTKDTGQKIISMAGIYSHILFTIPLGCVCPNSLLTVAFRGYSDLHVHEAL